MKYCEKCGNELFDEAVICPKCGCAVRNEKLQKAGELSGRISVCALVGFILSLASIISIFNILGLLAIAGFVNSVIGLVNCTKKNQRGKGFAIAGIVVGAIFGVIGLFAWIKFISGGGTWGSLLSLWLA